MKITRKTDPGDYPMWLVAAVLDELGLEVTGMLKPIDEIVPNPLVTLQSRLRPEYRQGFYFDADGNEWDHDWNPIRVGKAVSTVVHQPTYTQVTGEGQVTTGWVADCSCGEYAVATSLFEEAQDDFISHRDGPLDSEVPESDDGGMGFLTAFIDLAGEAGAQAAHTDRIASIYSQMYLKALRDEYPHEGYPTPENTWQPGHVAMVQDDGSMPIHRQTADALGLSTDDVLDFPEDAHPGRLYYDPGAGPG